MTVDDIIDVLGGKEAAALRFQLTPDAIKKWRYNGLPPKHWVEISKATNLTLEKISQIELPASAEPKAAAQ